MNASKFRTPQSSEPSGDRPPKEKPLADLLGAFQP